LKSPDHVFALEAIRATYPDAKIVFLHRDPLSVVASCATLAEHLRRPFANHVDPVEVGRQVSTRLIESAEHMVHAAMRPEPILHLQFQDVVSRPLEAVDKVYRHCGLSLSQDAERRMAAFLARPRRHVKRRYRLTEFGLNARTLANQFASYAENFGVLPEVAWLNLAT